MRHAALATLAVVLMVLAAPHEPLAATQDEQCESLVVIPVMLQPVDPKLQDLKGLEEKQIFRLDRPSFSEPKAFAHCKDSRRDDFALELFRLVEARLARIFPDH